VQIEGYSTECVNILVTGIRCNNIRENLYVLGIVTVIVIGMTLVNSISFRIDKGVLKTGDFPQ
jgi:hypothetical protein